jgi:hypothetical protein
MAVLRCKADGKVWWWKKFPKFGLSDFHIPVVFANSNLAAAHLKPSFVQLLKAG